MCEMWGLDYHALYTSNRFVCFQIAPKSFTNRKSAPCAIGFSSIPGDYPLYKEYITSVMNFVGSIGARSDDSCCVVDLTWRALILLVLGIREWFVLLGWAQRRELHLWLCATTSMTFYHLKIMIHFLFNVISSAHPLCFLLFLYAVYLGIARWFSRSTKQ